MTTNAQLGAKTCTTIYLSLAFQHHNEYFANEHSSVQYDTDCVNDARPTWK
jgi:hypothetical protein